MDFSTVSFIASELYARRDKLHYLLERRTIQTGEFDHVLRDINDSIDFIFNIKSEINTTESDDEIQRLQSEVDRKESELSARESDCASIQSELQNIESEISFIESEISTLESDLQTAESTRDED